MKKRTVTPCPCGTGKTLDECCGRYHAGAPAPDAEKLMRSRYSAFALGLEAYLLATWHPSTRPAALHLAHETPMKWVRLEVKGFTEDQEQAVVSFVAHYKQQGRAGRLTETSQFVREGGRWFYVEGDVAQ